MAQFRGTFSTYLIECRHCGIKRSYTVLEDNDPTGYKSNEAKEAKRNHNIVALEFPRCSPDLNPMDHFLWDEVERRMQTSTPTHVESISDFKARLRRVALGIPEAVIRKSVADLKKRIVDCYNNDGKFVKWD